MTERRTLHPELQRELDALDDKDRAFLLWLGRTGPLDGKMLRLLVACGTQAGVDHTFARAQETTLLTRLEAEHAAYVDEVDLRVNGPLPRRSEGIAATFDPDTRTWNLK